LLIKALDMFDGLPGVGKFFCSCFHGDCVTTNPLR
jgi:hypothetical protein